MVFVFGAEFDQDPKMAFVEVLRDDSCKDATSRVDDVIETAVATYTKEKDWLDIPPFRERDTKIVFSLPSRKSRLPTYRCPCHPAPMIAPSDPDFPDQGTQGELLRLQPAGLLL